MRITTSKELTIAVRSGIATQEVIIGNAPADVLKAAQAWTRANRSALLAKWQELNE